jgi:hypothetical protein
MKAESREYYAARERAERLAAENATCPEARLAHEEMARAYEELAAKAALQPGEERPAA